MYKNGKKLRVAAYVHPEVFDWIDTERAMTGETRSGFIENILSEMCYIATGLISDDCGEVI